MRVRNYKIEHQTLLGLVSKISNHPRGSEQRRQHYAMLRNALVAHTEAEARYFYDCADRGLFTDGFIKLFDDNFHTVYYEVLDLLDTIIEHSIENEGDMAFLADTLKARIAFEESVLFPVFREKDVQRGMIAPQPQHHTPRQPGLKAAANKLGLLNMMTFAIGIIIVYLIMSSL